MLPQLKRVAWVTLLSAMALGPMGAAGAAAAGYTYIYKSKNYNTMISGCLTSAMHITMKLVMPAKLAPNLTSAIANPTAWVVSDGLHSFKGSAAKPFSGSALGIFSTNAAGNITVWNVNTSLTKNFNFLETVGTIGTAGTATGNDGSTDNQCSPAGKASVYSDPGTWKGP